MTIKSGYAKTSQAAIVFNEDDTGLEVIPFENAEDAQDFAESIIADGYARAYCTTPEQLVEIGSCDKLEGYCGAVFHSTAQKLLEEGNVTVDTMFNFDDICLEGDKDE